MTILKTIKKVLPILLVVAIILLLATTMTKPLSLGSSGEKQIMAMGERHSLTLIEEARLRDLTSQIERGMLYAKQAGLQVGTAETALVTLKPILKDVGALLGTRKSAVDHNYETMNEKLRKGLQVAENTLKFLRDRFKEKFPWFKPHEFEDNPDIKAKEHALVTGAFPHYFYGTLMPWKAEPKMVEIFSSIKPFQFDFLNVENRD